MIRLLGLLCFISVGKQDLLHGEEGECMAIGCGNV